jgi:hypothetical protein
MKRLLITTALVVALVASFATPVLAADPTVTITMSAKIVAITNTQANWAIGAVEVDDVVYFSATGAQNDTYSQIENTGNVAVDIEIQGTDAEGGTYDWVLAATTGDQQYSLYANSEATPTVYDVQVKSSVYIDLTTALAALDTYDWSMKFTAPTAFHASDAGASKTATVTLVASEAP